MTAHDYQALGALPPWHRHAACAQVYVPAPGGTSDPWYPAKGRGEAKVGPEETARQVCARCPVRRACLEDALIAGERYGLRGGYSPKERAGMKPRDVAR